MHAPHLQLAVQPREDFKNWQHYLIVKKFALTAQRGAKPRSLYEFARNEREQMKTFKLRTDMVFAPRLKQI